MPKKPSKPEATTPTRVGPPPIAPKVEPRKPKPDKRKRGLAAFISVARSFSVGNLRRDLGHLLLYGVFAFVGIFLIGALFSFGGAPDSENEQLGGTDYPIIATVDGTEFKREELDQQIERFGLRDQGTIAYLHRQTGQVFDGWVQQQLLLAEAKQRNIAVADADLDAEIDKIVQEQLDAERGTLSERKWQYRLQQRGTSAEAVAAEARKKVNEGRGDLRISLTLERVTKAIEQEVKVTDDDLKAKYEELSGRLILLRTMSPKPPEPLEGIAESPDEAKNRQEAEAKWKADLAAKKADAEKLLAQVKAAPAKFEEFARTKSDDPRKDNGGKFEPVTRESQRFGDEFKTKAFALKPGEISGLIEGNEGWLIVQADTKTTWPDDFDDPDPRDYDAALKLAEKYRAEIVGGKDFAEIAKQHSEDPGSAEKGGVYEMTGRGVWVKPFEKIAFGLEVDELSPPVKTAFGVHLIQCLERELYEKGETPPPDEKPDLPEGEVDPDEEFLKQLPKLKNADIKPARQVKIRHILIKAQDPKRMIEDKRKQAETELQQKHSQEFLDELVKKAYADGRVVVQDPQIKAYLADKDGDREEAFFWLQRAAKAWPERHPEVHFEYAQMLSQANMWGMESDQQVAAAKALASAGGPEAVDALIKALDIQYPDVRKAAAEALGTIGDKKALPRLEQLAQSEMDQSVKTAVGEAIRKLGGTPPADTAATPTAPAPAPTAP